VVRSPVGARNPGAAAPVSMMTGPLVTMLRNPLASPDVIGVSSGASAAAVFGIVIGRHHAVAPVDA
jgi:ABC-type Fe3+-siderophore transport system permease subunit